MTLVAVVSDYLLHPFYPQFFELRFGVKDPEMVGYYFAAICFMVMIAFPFWAYVSKKRAELNIIEGNILTKEAEKKELSKKLDKAGEELDRATVAKNYIEGK